MSPGRTGKFLSTPGIAVHRSATTALVILMSMLLLLGLEQHLALGWQQLARQLYNEWITIATSEFALFSLFSILQPAVADPVIGICLDIARVLDVSATVTALALIVHQSRFPRNLTATPLDSRNYARRGRVPAVMLLASCLARAAAACIAAPVTIACACVFLCVMQVVAGSAHARRAARRVFMGAARVIVLELLFVAFSLVVAKVVLRRAVFVVVARHDQHALYPSRMVACAQSLNLSQPAS